MSRAIGPQTEDSWLSDAPPRRVGGRVYLRPRSPGIVTKPDLFIPDHQRVRFPIVLPTGPFISPTDEIGRALPPTIPTPAPAGSSRDAEIDTLSTTQLRSQGRNASRFPDRDFAVNLVDPASGATV